LGKSKFLTGKIPLNNEIFLIRSFLTKEISNNWGMFFPKTFTDGKELLALI
jgi:hypothetical protein